MSDETYDAEPRGTESITHAIDVQTGHESIDAALASLRDLDELDINEHPQAYDTIHGVLREALAHAGRPEDPPDAP